MDRASISLLLIAVCGCISAFPQDLRNVGSPKATTYSESKPYTPRPDDKNAKKDKKDKKQKTLPETKEIAVVPPGEGTLTIPVKVYDKGGHPVVGLEDRDLRVYLDDKEVEITSVRTKPEALDVVLLLDVSPSGIKHLKTIKSLASQIVGQLQPQDKVTVVTFGAGAKIRVDRSLDRTLILKAIQKLEMSDGTAFYDALSKIAEQRPDSRSNPVTLVVISDGVDTTSKSSYAGSLSALEKGSFVSYVFFLDTFAEATEQFRQPPQFVPHGSSLKEITEDYREARNYLDDLWDLSGGRVYLPSTDVNVPDEVRGRYYVTIRLPLGESGARHSIRVRVTHPGLQILAKGSFVNP